MRLKIRADFTGQVGRNIYNMTTLARARARARTHTHTHIHTHTHTHYFSLHIILM